MAVASSIRAGANIVFYSGIIPARLILSVIQFKEKESASSQDKPISPSSLLSDSISPEPAD